MVVYTDLFKFNNKIKLEFVPGTNQYCIMPPLTGKAIIGLNNSSCNLKKILVK